MRDFEIRAVEDVGSIWHLHYEACGRAPQADGVYLECVADSGEVVGFVHLKQVTLVDGMFIKRDWRGQGLPRAFADFVIERAPAGFKMIWCAASRHMRKLATDMKMKFLDGEAWLFTKE